MLISGTTSVTSAQTKKPLPSLSAKADYAIVDGAIQLPEFIVYATDAAESATAAVGTAEVWKFDKSLDQQAGSEVISVLGLENEVVDISTPAIQFTLVSRGPEKS